jgi:hypothetical protein
VLAVVTVGGLAALVASAQEAARQFVEAPLAPEAWQEQVKRLLLRGLAPGPRRAAAPGEGAVRAAQP